MEIINYNGLNRLASYFGSKKYNILTPCVCPECGEEVIPKFGKTKIDHFAHKINSTCPYTNRVGGDGESEAHRLLKIDVYKSLLNHTENVSIEHKLGRYRVDVMVNDIAIEVINTHNDEDKFNYFNEVKQKYIPILIGNNFNSINLMVAPEKWLTETDLKHQQDIGKYLLTTNFYFDRAAYREKLRLDQENRDRLERAYELRLQRRLEKERKLRVIEKERRKIEEEEYKERKRQEQIKEAQQQEDYRSRKRQVVYSYLDSLTPKIRYTKYEDMTSSGEIQMDVETKKSCLKIVYEDMLSSEIRKIQALHNEIKLIYEWGLFSAFYDRKNNLCLKDDSKIELFNDMVVIKKQSIFKITINPKSYGYTNPYYYFKYEKIYDGSPPNWQPRIV